MVLARTDEAIGTLLDACAYLRLEKDRKRLANLRQHLAVMGMMTISFHLHFYPHAPHWRPGLPGGDHCGRATQRPLSALVRGSAPVGVALTDLAEGPPRQGVDHIRGSTPLIADDGS